MGSLIRRGRRQRANWQGRKGYNPDSAVMESRATPDSLSKAKQSEERGQPNRKNQLLLLLCQEGGEASP